MSIQIQLRRGTEYQNSIFTGAPGEITMDTTTNTFRVHDGSTVGGHKIDKSDNVVHKASTETITGQKTFSDITKHNKEVIVTAASPYGQFRAIGGNYGFLIRNDGSTTYFLLTDSGDQYGTWNSYRPLSISNSTGDVTAGGNWTFSNTIQGTASRALWADLAENYETDCNYPVGTLIKFGGARDITIADTVCNGIISEKPGYLLDSGLQNSLPVALVGKTPVRVIGKVNKFDKLMLSDIPGIAQVKPVGSPRNTIGIALESSYNENEKLVNSVVKVNLD